MPERHSPAKLSPREVAHRLAAAPDRRPLRYLTVHPLKADRTGDRIEPPADLSGLEFFHRLQESDGRESLASYWDGQESFRREGTRFPGACAEAPVLEGWVEAFTPKRKRWWRRVKLGTLLLSTAAFLGAVEVVRNHYDWLFESPSHSIEMVGTPTFRYVEGNSWQESLRVWNLSPVAPEDLRLELAELRADKGGDPVAVSLPPLDIRELRPGAYQDLAVRGSAPPAGSYRLVIEVSAKAGLVPGRKSSSLERPFEVWPSGPEVGNLQLVDVKAAAGGIRLATLQGSVRTGVSLRGVECEMQAEGFPGIRHHILNYPGAGSASSLSNEEVGAEVFVLTWRGPEIDGFAPRDFQIALSGPAEIDWKALAAAARVRCVPSQEEVDRS